MTSVLMEERREGHGAGHRDWGDAPTSLGALAAIRGWRRQKDPPLEHGVGAQPADTLVLDFRPLHTERMHFCCFGQLSWWYLFIAVTGHKGTSHGQKAKLALPVLRGAMWLGTPSEAA